MALAALLGALAVVAGAFGAHAFSAVLPAAALDVWKTAVLYQFIHVLAILALSTKNLTKILWLGGIFLFSGSLYFLSTNSLHQFDLGWLGPITPLGGLLFIAGWLSYASNLWQDKAENGGKA